MPEHRNSVVRDSEIGSLSTVVDSEISSCTIEGRWTIQGSRIQGVELHGVGSIIDSEISGQCCFLDTCNLNDVHIMGIPILQLRGSRLERSIVSGSARVGGSISLVNTQVLEMATLLGDFALTDCLFTGQSILAGRGIFINVEARGAASLVSNHSRFFRNLQFNSGMRVLDSEVSEDRSTITRDISNHLADEFFSRSP